MSLAQLAYGNLGTKQSRDIDLLVTPEAVPRALQTLERLGYFGSPPLPPMTDKRYGRWIKFAHEFLLFHETTSVMVELHWKLADNDYFLPGISAASSTQLVPISNQMSIRTFTDDDLFTYLCVHGAMHGWSRLKWLADVAALMAGDTIDDAKRRMDAARSANAEHCAAQTFVLCDRLFATQSVAEISRALRGDLRYRWLERTALKAMTVGHAEIEPGNAPFDRASVLVSHLMMGRGWRFAVKEAWNKLNGPADLLFTFVPSWLGFLYPVIRVASWLTRRGRLRAWPKPRKAKPN